MLTLIKTRIRESREDGFSLIELIVVLSLLPAFALILAPLFSVVFNGAAVIQSNVASTQKSLTMESDLRNFFARSESVVVNPVDPSTHIQLIQATVKTDANVWRCENYAFGADGDGSVYHKTSLEPIPLDEGFSTWTKVANGVEPTSKDASGIASVYVKTVLQGDTSVAVLSDSTNPEPIEFGLEFMEGRVSSSVSGVQVPAVREVPEIECSIE